MFLHLSVILFTRGCVSQHEMGRVVYPSMQWGGGCGRHPSGQTPPGGADPPRKTSPPPPQVRRPVDGAHPTGMHSCYHHDFYQIFNVVIHFK